MIEDWQFNLIKEDIQLTDRNTVLIPNQIQGLVSWHADFGYIIFETFLTHSWNIQFTLNFRDNDQSLKYIWKRIPINQMNGI